MQNVTDNYIALSKSETRKINTKVNIDWDNDGEYTDETNYIDNLSIEKETDEPQSGVFSSQADISLINNQNRYTVNKIDIPTNIKIGFGEEDNLQLFTGKSELPKITRQKYEMHLWDELDKLKNFTLPHATGFQDIRTDQYIYEILKAYWGDDYFEIHNCDTYDGDGTWTADAGSENVSTETVNYKEGIGGVKFDTDGTDNGGIDNSGIDIDLSDYEDTGKIQIWVYLPSITNLTTIRFLWGDNYSKYWYKDVTTDYLGNSFVVGWNLLEFDWATATKVSTPNSSSVKLLNFAIRDVSYDAEGIIIDRIAICNKYIPCYKYDIGVNNITIANFNRNTALYEIKTACEAEGGRFYIDEYGDYIFENRQHYIINNEHRNSVTGFNFDNIMDYIIPNDQSKIINKIIFNINKRIEQSIKVIWTYSQTPKAITASQTIEVWATFEDPCIDITTPVATTDYTANTQADGAGTDKTAQISINITKFANSAKLLITNNDAGTVYLTFMQLRGKPYELIEGIEYVSEDTTSQTNYGLRELRINNKYLNNESDASALGTHLLNIYKNPTSIITLKKRSEPQLQIGDQVGINVNEVDYIQRIISINNKLTKNGLDMEIRTRTVPSTELKTYWQLDVSKLGTISEGGDGHILAP